MDGGDSHDDDAKAASCEKDRLLNHLLKLALIFDINQDLNNRDGVDHDDDHDNNLYNETEAELFVIFMTMMIKSHLCHLWERAGDQ